MTEGRRAPLNKDGALAGAVLLIVSGTGNYFRFPFFPFLTFFLATFFAVFFLATFLAFFFLGIFQFSPWPIRARIDCR